MRNPFTFMYPPALVEWFSVLADNMRTASSCAGNDVLSILRLLKSNERLREGCAQEIAFRCGQPPPQGEFASSCLTMVSAWAR